MALEPCWLTDRQIEAARVALTRGIKRGGKVWIRVFPDKPVTKKPQETRMGKGKGAPEGWVAVIKPGRILFEMEGVSITEARAAMRLASAKLPMKTRFATRFGRGAGVMKVAELADGVARADASRTCAPARARPGRAGVPPAAAEVDGPGRGRQQDPAAAPRAGARQDGAAREGRQGLAMAKAEIVGTVVSNKMAKSVVVTIERQVRDGLYGKQQRLHVALHGARREERGQGRRPRGARAVAAARGASAGSSRASSSGRRRSKP